MTSYHETLQGNEDGQYPRALAFSYAPPSTPETPYGIFSLGRLVAVQPDGPSSARGGDGVALVLDTAGEGGRADFYSSVSFPFR